MLTDNNRVQRFHAYIDHTRARAVARSAMAIGAKAAISRRGKRVKRAAGEDNFGPIMPFYCIFEGFSEG